MNFCSQCGETVIQKIPDDDNRERFVCSSCEFIHYQNPKIVVGVLPIIVDNDGIEKILLCKRAIEPRHGYWTLPAGFMENQESLEEGAAREAAEEANVSFKALNLYLTMSMPHIDQVYVMFIAKAENEFSPGIESLETKLYAENDIPWDELAFPVIEKTLRHYFADKKKRQQNEQNNYDDIAMNSFPVHNIVFRRDK